LGLVNTWMGDRLRAGKASRYITSHLGWLYTDLVYDLVLMTGQDRH